LILPNLEKARVLIVGVGGLGAPAAMQLAAAGVGAIWLIDGDRVEVSNLQRQVIYRTEDLGQPKAAVAARRIAAAYPHVEVEPFNEQLTAANLPRLFLQSDFVIDATDQVDAKFLINDGAVEYKVPYSHAGVVAFRGQTFTILPERTACLRCIFPSPPNPDDQATCQTAGILGAFAGTIGLIQASEAVKHLMGFGGLLTNRLLTGDAWRQRWRHIRISPSPRCPVCHAAAFR
jgi:molybdopterin/thiamine biosynthesis adenylyltransferase